MNFTRVAAWILGASVCGAWLVSAAGVSRPARSVRPPTRSPDAVRFDALAADVQAQAGRLRDRMAAAPAPAPVERNPFRFRTPAPVREAAAATASLPSLPEPRPAEPREPVLRLIGIAESRVHDGGVRRTAMITGPSGELIMVVAGQRILGRYDVTAVGADAVELQDLETASPRRLILR